MGDQAWTGPPGAELDGRDPGPSTSLAIRVTLSVPPRSGSQFPQDSAKVNSTSLWGPLPPRSMDVQVLLEEMHCGHSGVRPHFPPGWGCLPLPCWDSCCSHNPAAGRALSKSQVSPTWGEAPHGAHVRLPRCLWAQVPLTRLWPEEAREPLNFRLLRGPYRPWDNTPGGPET